MSIEIAIIYTRFEETNNEWFPYYKRCSGAEEVSKSCQNLP